jgi:hypothetical protein
MWGGGAALFIDAMTELCCSALLSSCQTCGVMTHENEKDWLELGVLQLLLQMLSELYIILAIWADVSKWGISTPLHAQDDFSKLEANVNGNGRNSKL